MPGAYVMVRNGEEKDAEGAWRVVKLDMVARMCEKPRGLFVCLFAC